jgi:hypothetical protein
MRSDSARPENFQAVKNLNVGFPLTAVSHVIDGVGEYIRGNANARQRFIDCYKFAVGREVCRIKVGINYAKNAVDPKAVKIRFLAKPLTSSGPLRAHLNFGSYQKFEDLTNLRFKETPADAKGEYKSVWEEFIDHQKSQEA